MLQNQHIMGWGAGNPEPAPGKYDFRDLDRRIKFMAASQSHPGDHAVLRARTG